MRFIIFDRMEVVLGIDIGGTFTKFGLVDKEGTIQHEDEVPTTGHASIESFIDALYHASARDSEEDEPNANGQRNRSGRTQWEFLFRNHRTCTKPCLEGNNSLSWNLWKQVRYSCGSHQ